jgi:hypothetical protein
VTALLNARPGTVVVVCDVRGLVRPGAADLDRLGRLRLVTRRRGCALVLRNTPLRLRLLLELAGLSEVFECDVWPASPPDVPGHSEAD